MRSVAAAFLVTIVVMSSLAVLGPHVGASGDSGPSPAIGTFIGWRDDFNNTSKVAGSSNVVFTGQDVRLVSANLTRVGLVVGHGAPGDFDSYETGAPTVLFDQGIYKMWYHGGGGAPSWRIGYANSTDGITWIKRGVVLSPSLPAEGSVIGYPDVVKVGAGYRMYYSGYDGNHYRIFLATSADGLVWAKQGIVMNLGTGGSFDDLYVYEASVIVDNGTFTMWYTGLSSSSPAPSIGLATSSDGIVWTKQGQVLAPGPAGSIDSRGVQDPTVRIVGSVYEMLYTAVYPGLRARLALAASSDGVAWQKRGYVLDLQSPDQDVILSAPNILVEPSGAWKVYYQARGSALQIFLAVRANVSPIEGWLRSVAVTVPGGLEWAWFNQSASVLPGASLTVSVRDAATGAVLPGMDNLTSGSIDLSAVDPVAFPRLAFEGWLRGDDLVTPILDSWEVSWTDRTGPVFAGLESAIDLGTGGAARLAWSTASDPSPPIVYRVYQATGMNPFDFGSPVFSTAATAANVTGLVDGTAYRFAVRAVDGWGNEDTNVESRTVIPTTPVDSTPPTFAGLTNATDARTGGAVRLSWLTATDPDTAASNSDPSLPIRYMVFFTRSGVPFDFGSPVQTTGNLTALVSGLSDGVSYDFLVRATDSRGNGETNAVTRNAIPTHPYDSTPPTFAGVKDATDLGTGDQVRVTWDAATDPDTPESGVDPSLPITYSVFVSQNASGLGGGTAVGTTNATSLNVGGLRPGVTYYVLVRATDAAGNLENNTHVVSFQLKEASPVVSYWWVILLFIIVGVVALTIVIWWRRRKEKEAPPSPPASPP